MAIPAFAGGLGDRLSSLSHLPLSWSGAIVIAWVVKMNVLVIFEKHMFFERSGALFALFNVSIF